MAVLTPLVVGSASAALFGISPLKDCTSPINVGAAYSCEFSFLNTVQTSHNTVFISSLTDTVHAASGDTAHTYDINSTTIGPTGNSNNWSSVNTSCDPTGCTVTFGGEIDSPFLSHYTAAVADFPTLTDDVTFHWKSLCDQVSAGCNPNFQDSPQNAEATINPIATQVATTIHDASNAAVTTVQVGTTVHDFVTVSDVLQNEPTPTGNVNIDWFTNGTCTAPAASNSGSIGPLDANGQFDATGFAFTPTTAGQFSFLAHYEGSGAFTASDGTCEPLNVVDAYIQITPQDATNPVNTTHTLTITVNANPNTGSIVAGTATATILASSTTGGFDPNTTTPPTTATCNYPAGPSGSSSCTVVIKSAAAGETDVQASSAISQVGVTGSLTRTTGTAANTTAGCSTDCGNAVKHWRAPPQGIIAPTQTTCSDFTSGTASTLASVNYSVTGGNKIGQGINPGVFFYYTKITTTTANQVVTVSQSNTSTNNAALFGILQGQAWLYPADCSSHVVGTTTGVGDTGASFTIKTPGTYIIGIKFQTKTIAGTTAPVPANITYNFTTSLGGTTGASVQLIKQ
jgi:hypothetical protein